MKTKHTQEPWLIGANFTEITTSSVEIPKGSKSVICYISGLRKTNEEIKANAKLIACAPELLQACIDIYNEPDTDNGTKRFLSIIIKKATE